MTQRRPFQYAVSCTDITGRSPKQAFLLQGHHVMRTSRSPAYCEEAHPLIEGAWWESSPALLVSLTTSKSLLPAVFLLEALRRRDLKDRVTRCLALKSREGRIFRDIEVGSNHTDLQEILFEYGSGFPGFQLGHRDHLRMATTGERCRPCCPDVTYPLHDPVRRNQPTLSVLLNQGYRNRMRLTTFAAAHGEQRRLPYFDASTQKRRDQCISYAVSEIDLKRFSHERVPSFFSYMYAWFDVKT